MSTQDVADAIHLDELLGKKKASDNAMERLRGDLHSKLASKPVIIAAHIVSIGCFKRSSYERLDEFCLNLKNMCKHLSTMFNRYHPMDHNIDETSTTLLKLEPEPDRKTTTLNVSIESPDAFDPNSPVLAFHLVNEIQLAKVAIEMEIRPLAMLITSIHLYPEPCYQQCDEFCKVVKKKIKVMLDYHNDLRRERGHWPDESNFKSPIKTNQDTTNIEEVN